MKNLKMYAICLCTMAMAMTGCVKDVEVTSTVPSTTTGEGNTTFVLTIPNESTKSVEDSGVHDQGTPAEYDVNSVVLYLFDASTEVLVQTISLEGITLVSDTSDDLIVRYSSDKCDVEVGSYNIFAVANSAKVYDINTQTEFLAYEDDTYGTNSLMSYVPDAGFVMTNRGSANASVSIAANEDKEVTIELERVTVKVEVAQNYDSYDLKNAVDSVYATIKLQNYQMVNLATNYYLFRHVADLTTFTAPTYTLTANFGDVSDTDGYVIDPYFFSKVASGASTFTNADSFFYQSLLDVDPESNTGWSVMPASTTSSINYCLENTLYQEAQLNAYTTGVVFEAKVSPKEVIIDNLGGTTTNYSNMIYYCNYKFYNSVATLESCLGFDIPDIDDASTTEELQDNYITRLTLDGNDYMCYYNYWIKHYDNDDVKVMGVMEFGVVRNNHYKLSINSIAGLGTGEPSIVPDQPDEIDETLSVSLNVVPWIVREQTDVELK